MNHLRNYIPLNNKQVKEVHKKLKDQFEFSEKLDHVFFQKKDKIYIISKDFRKIDPKNFSINAIGLYIIKIEKPGLRLSIEGSQIIGPKTNKNILELDNPEEWLKGKDIELNKKLGPIVIIKYKKDFLGSGICSKGKVINCIPKSRRVK